MTSVIFVVGHCDNEKAYQDFMFDDPKGWSIKNKIQNRLPTGTPMLITRWDHDILSEINNFVKINDDVCLIGFSFGGSKAIETCFSLRRSIKKLILIDPVNYHNPDYPNLSGFTISPTIVDCTCYYRLAKAMPWSSRVTNISIPSSGKIYTKVENINYPCDGKNPWADHGKMVWSQDLIDLIKGNL